MGEPDQSTSQSHHNIDRVVSSNYNVVSSAGTLDFDSLDGVIVDTTVSEPTSAVLNYCQKWFLLPFVHILGVVGLRPITIDSTNFSTYLGHLQTFIVIVFLGIGYTLQYVAHFRRDRGFPISQNISDYVINSIRANRFYGESYRLGEMLFVYCIPGALHFIGFLAALHTFRISDNEQLQNLVERVFILSSQSTRLLFTLWSYIVCGFIWLSLMTAYVIMLEVNDETTMKINWFGTPTVDMHYWTKFLLIVTVFCHDLVQTIVLSSYAIHCCLLRCYLYGLQDKLLQNTIEPLDWMREMVEFRKLLRHLNKKNSLPVCFFTILNLAYSFSNAIYLFEEYDHSSFPVKIFSLNVGNLMLWLTASLFPFFQAASLTLACQSAQQIGHRIRMRPFVHHNTSSDDLNSVLLYSSSLRMSAKLFRMPIKGNYLCFVILTMIMVIITLGMCLNVSVGL